MAEFDVNAVPESNESSSDSKVHEVSKIEAGALLGLAAYGAVSLVKGAVRKYKDYKSAKKILAEAAAEKAKEAEKPAAKKPAAKAKKEEPAEE